MSSFENSFQKQKQIFRNIEKLAKKWVNLKGSIKFNKTCLNNELYTKFVHILYNIYIYKVACIFQNELILQPSRPRVGGVAIIIKTKQAAVHLLTITVQSEILL